jgi:hypothetical protein
MESSRLLTEFTIAERGKFNERWTNLFPQSVGHANAFGRYLDIVLGRYEAVAAEFIDDHSRWMATMHGRATIGMAEIDEHRSFQTRVALEIESFYLVAKIFLDRLAMHVEYLFGVAPHGPGLGGHRKLTTKLPAYAIARGLTPPPESLLDRARVVQQRISDYRDDEVAHATNPRVLRATGFTNEGRVWINGGLLYPTAREQQDTGIFERLQSATPTELGEAIDAYVRELIEWILANLPRANGYVGAQERVEAVEREA